MKLYGSVDNRLMENMQSNTPQVGMGATKLLYSDSHAYTIVEVINEKVVIVKRDDVKALHKGMSDSQEWEYTFNPKAQPITLKKHKKGYWYQVGDTTTKFLLGVRQEFYDYTF